MGVFPFTTFAAEQIQQVELPVFTEMAYDYENNCLLRKAGSTYKVYKDEAIKIWIYKALMTKRYAFSAYTHAYGCELDELIGQVTKKGIFESEAKRYITECLMVNPYIQELSDFTFEYSERTTITFVVTTIYGRFTYESEVYNE